jgi:spermidine synthase
MKITDRQQFWPFLFFFISGFCGLLYQVTWLRLAFHSFGVITPVISLVVSVFMLGLALGSWLGGILGRRLHHSKYSPLFFYGVVELLIGISSLAVPPLFLTTERWLWGYGELNSVAYLFHSALLITICILPWCILMGLTYPLMLAHFKRRTVISSDSFSFLYLANVIGAMVGTLLTAFVLIEILGFTKTLLVAGFLNLAIAVASFVIASKQGQDQPQAAKETKIEPTSIAENKIFILTTLFLTGFCSMALEVVWTRAYAAVLETTVYAFASLVATYLFATWIGSYLYRRDLARKQDRSDPLLFTTLACSVFLPVLLNDPRLHSLKSLVLFSIVPLSATLGYLTPKLIDRLAGGDPQRAGTAYAINILGCIIGPLLASYFLLPLFGSKETMVVLGAPLIILVLFCVGTWKQRLVGAGISLALCLVGGAVSLSYEERFADRDYAGKGIIRRDHTATVISYGTKIEDKHLYVNGVGITVLNTATKWMAYLPLAQLGYQPKSALVICFGMGTTFRSLMRWPDLKQVIAVELVPSVKEAFAYYHADAASIMADPRGKVVIDDGRRFLRRSREVFDVITLDPPPPVQAAGSGMLYSSEFIQLMKSHLNPTGILAHWIPYGADPVFMRGALAAIHDHFAHIRYFVSPLGTHILASDQQLPAYSPEQLTLRLPEAAQKDLLEWEPNANVLALSRDILNNEQSFAQVWDSKTPLQTAQRTDDNHPLNEYYKVRGWMTKLHRIGNVLAGRAASEE